jgi:myo-inositol-1(or 4)-monophosphatase
VLSGAFDDELALAREAAERAGALALALQRQGVSHWLKGPGNPVTEADLALDRLLKEALLGARPEFGWLSEETADSPGRLGARALWVVDPIDGTRDFLRGRPGWAVSVALVVGGRVEAGVLAAPARQTVYAARRGGGATCNGRPIAVSGRGADWPVRLPIEPQVLTSPLWGEGFVAEAVDKPNSLALRLALVAEGAADAMVDGRHCSEWDVAAASLIVAEAGGMVSTRDGAPIRFNKPEPGVAGLVAATPAWHAPMQARLEAALHALAERRRRSATTG